MKLELTNKEFLKYTNFIAGEKNYCVFDEDKYLMFHGSKDGAVGIDIFFISLFYTLIGYKIITCYPKQMSKNLRFGKFVLPNCSTYLNNDIKVWEDFYELIIMSKKQMGDSGKINLKKKNRN